jgi:hypothetical protein
MTRPAVRGPGITKDTDMTMLKLSLILNLILILPALLGLIVTYRWTRRMIRQGIRDEQRRNRPTPGPQTK